MTDRDDYPNDPYRGRTERGYDYDPLSDPLPSQPPPRGRRARPGFEEQLQQPMTGPGPYAGRPEGRPGEFQRPSGAAEALRGSRAARSGGARPNGSQSRGSAQEALEALAGLGDVSTTQEPSARRPEPALPAEPESPAEPPLPEPSPVEDTERRPRRGRRRRGEPGAETGAPEEQPDRRPRRRRGRRDPDTEGGFLSEVPDETDVFDSGNFPGVDAPADSGSFSYVEEDKDEDEEPPRRGRRRRRGRDSGAPAAQDERGGSAREPAEAEAVHAEHAPEEDEPEEGPRSRRRGRRRSRRKQPVEPREQEESAEAEVGSEGSADAEDEDYEPGLDDIAEAYGGSRRSRRKLKEAKRRAQGKAKKSKEAGAGKRRRPLVILTVLVLLLAIGGGGFAVMRTYVFPADYAGEGAGEVTFVIEEGDSGAVVAQNLADENVVASARSFTNALDEASAQELTPGTYRLAEEMSGEHAVAALLEPDNRLGGRVSIPEGLRAERIIAEIAEQTALSEEELHDAYEQTDELNLPDYAEEGPEGYLFPSTYRFEPDAEALSVLKTMVTQYRETAEEIDLEERASEGEYDPNEVMAIASIVQAESGNIEDMPKISRVVHNRLDIDMPLQMDSTCFYAIEEYGIALNNDQLAECEADTSGFDTYHTTGLIPGPFVAPGKDAIEAALDPEEGDWLYFVATDPENGVTEFTDSHDEFEELKARFQENWGGEG